MKEIELEERKKISLEILEYIHKFCVENNIKYFINYGTLLGAVRHNGFIPWDDDIDISMVRSDYEKFLTLFSSDKYSIANYRNKKYYSICFSKIYANNTYGIKNNKIKLNFGIAVDIFPMDNIPNDEKTQKKFYSKYSFLFFFYKRALLYNNGNNKIKIFFKTIFHILFPARKFARILDKYVIKYNKKDTTYVANILHSPKLRLTKKEDFEKQCLLQFENKEFYAPIGYKNVLSVIYGKDYMIPPPEKDRVSIHDEKYYYVEN